MAKYSAFAGPVENTMISEDSVTSPWSRRSVEIIFEAHRQAAAQEALQLHNFKIDGGEFPLTVLISDPAAKKKRTDAESTKSSLFVGGLNSKTTENDVNNLFSKVG